jgi:hypothetical protein
MLRRVTALICRHISRLPKGTPFATREVLGYGHRAAVDQVLCRLVKAGKIRRLTRGIFVRDPACVNVYGFPEIAKIKSESFQRMIADHPETTLEKFLGEKETQPQTTYSINGSSSKFKIGEKTIVLKEICQRKAALCETTLGRRMLALWSLGKGNVTEKLIQNVLLFYRGGLTWLRKNIFLLPAWLSDQLLSIETLKLQRVN